MSTPTTKAKMIALEALSAEYEDYAQGDAEDSEFSSAGKQKKVAVQIAKLHNRLAKKWKLDDEVDELEEDL